MGKLHVNRWIFDSVIGDAIDIIEHDKMYEYYQGVQEVLEIRKKSKSGGELDTVYVDFSGTLDGALGFSKMYGVNRKSIVLARDWRKLEGIRARLKPVNLDYDWSLLNWNHPIHVDARNLVYRHEALYGSV